MADRESHGNESLFASPRGVAVPNDVVAGLGVDPDRREDVIEGWWFYPVCNLCQSQWGPTAWRHVPENVQRHVDETGHDDWTLWFWHNLPADYDLRKMGAFTEEVLLHPDRAKYLNAPTCRDCHRIIRLPKDWEERRLRGMPNPIAAEGDLCDQCGEDVLAAAWLEEESREMQALDDKLRERPS